MLYAYFLADRSMFLFQVHKIDLVIRPIRALFKCNQVHFAPYKLVKELDQYLKVHEFEFATLFSYLTFEAR